MILPIVAYGHPILRKTGEKVTPELPNLDKLIADMWETMYESNGVGIAAPQVNRSLRLFVMDTQLIVEDFDEEERRKYPNESPYKGVIINPKKIAVEGELWSYNEGCLSIPKVRDDVQRQNSVTLEFEDENFERHVKTFKGITGRVAQHEYDHLEGKLFIDYLQPIKKRLIKKKLEDISAGKVKVDYRMLFNK